MSAAVAAALIVIAAGAPAAVNVKSPEACVLADDIDLAVDASGGIDTAEAVTVVVDAVADPAADGADPYILTVDLDLIGAQPLHRVAPLRAIECADVPALVAVLIDTQRKMHRLPKAAAGPPPVLVEAPPLKLRHRRSDAAEMELSWTPCDGPPGFLGGFNLSFGVGAALPQGGRGFLDFGYRLTNRFGLVGAVDGISGKSLGTYAGLAVYAPFDVVDFSLRVMVGGGVGNKSTGGLGGSQPCPPSSTQTEITSNGKLTIIPTAAGLYASPLVGARARIGWLFVEAGTYWQVGLDPLPGIYLGVGLALFPGQPPA